VLVIFIDASTLAVEIISLEFFPFLPSSGWIYGVVGLNFEGGPPTLFFYLAFLGDAPVSATPFFPLCRLNLL